MYSLKQCKADMLLLWGILKDNPQYKKKAEAIHMIDETDPDTAKRLYGLDCMCPCCEYSTEREGREDATCSYCPAWNYKEGRCYSYFKTPLQSNEFDMWDRALTYEDKKYWATLIYNRGLAIDTSSED